MIVHNNRKLEMVSNGYTDIIMTLQLNVNYNYKNNGS